MTDAGLKGGCLPALVGLVLLLAGLTGAALLIGFLAGWLVLGIAAATILSGVLSAAGIVVLLDNGY